MIFCDNFCAFNEPGDKMTVIKMVLTFYLDIFEALGQIFMNVNIHIVDVIL